VVAFENQTRRMKQGHHGKDLGMWPVVNIGHSGRIKGNGVLPDLSDRRSLMRGVYTVLRKRMEPQENSGVCANI
jgi:hypothetical protein